jgi:hypothetical protein
MTQHFCEHLLVLGVQAHRVDQAFFDEVKLDDGTFVVADDEVVLLRFEPGTA